MQIETQKPLVVKSASAGSGKTYSLVQDYLKLTLSDDVGPMNFSKINSMTFTNKAAWEMKERIIQALDQIGNIEHLTGKDKEKAEDLLKATETNLGIDREKLIKRAKRVLSEVLHNYEDFNVLTIDKFSLRLIRTFSRDLDLQDNFEVTLDEKLLLEQVIDDLLSKIGKPEHKEVTDLALNYAKSNLNEGNSWNFKRSLIEFSLVLTKETHQEFVEKLVERDFPQDGYNEILIEIKKLNEEHQAKCREIHAYFTSLHTSADDYPSKARGIFGQLSKLRERKLTSAPAPSATILKTISGENVKEEHNVDPKLIEMMVELYAYEKEQEDKMFTLQKLRANFFNLALLKFIYEELNAFKEKENIIGIFEFGKRIAELLQRENTPYIYERLGNRYNHYLLDEFQDTSRLQWLNLIPLVHESISQNHRNLIVGDPKQAIYRFRNGLVEQFVALPEIYNPEGDPEMARTSAYFKQMGVKEALDTNYRSKQKVVEFNNAFFTHLLGVLPDSLQEYYADIKQIPNSKEGGFVALDFLEEGIKKNELEEKEIEFLLEKVRACQADNYKNGDICVLVRNKKEGRAYAKALTDNGIKIVSSDSLIVSSDNAVSFCIDYLNLRRNTANQSLQIKFATSYFRLKELDPIVELEKYWKDGKVGRFDLVRFSKEYFGELEDLFFPFENLYDLGASLLKIVGLDELKNPYLHHLMDLFQNFDLQHGPDIRRFLEEWNAKQKDSTIQMPENDDAVKVMTVHKSKGLEFPVVIMPKLDWQIKTSKNEHFIELEDGELIYTQLKGKDAPEYILEKFAEEYVQHLLDELNTLYVAFTRPSERLYVLIENDSKKDEYYTKINQAVLFSLHNWGEDEALMSKRNTEGIEIGIATPKEEKSKETILEETNFMPISLSDQLWFPDLALQDAEALEKEGMEREKRFGQQLHLVLEHSENSEGINAIIEQFIAEGLIEAEFEEEIRQKAPEVVKFLESQEFAKNAEEVLNEQDIITKDKRAIRPDKIYVEGNKATVVDFKTGKEVDRDIHQVNNYCVNLYDMGYNIVEGYLLYTDEMKWIKVR